VNDGTYSTLLDGSSGYIQLPNSSLTTLSTNQLAYSEMVIEKQSATNAGGGLMGLGSGSALANGNKFSAYIGDDGRIGAWFYASAVKYTVVTASGVPGSGNFADGNAHLVLVTFSAVAPTSGSAYTFAIYVDGTQRAQTTGTLGATLPSSGNVLWTIGAAPVVGSGVTDPSASNYFAGYVQKAALWTSALSSANATTIENCAKNTGPAPSPTPALVQSTQQLRGKIMYLGHFGSASTGYTSATVKNAITLMPFGLGLRDSVLTSNSTLDNFYTVSGIKRSLGFAYPSLCGNGAGGGCSGTSFANPTAYINAKIANVGPGCAGIDFFETNNENDINPPVANVNWWAPYTSWWAQNNADQEALYAAASVTCPGVPILSPPLADPFYVSTATTNAITAGSGVVATTSSPSSGSWYVMVGDQLTPNDGSGDTVTVTATNPGTSFTATFASNHSAGVVWTNPLDHQQQMAVQTTACSGPCYTAISSHDSDNTYINGNPESLNALAAIFAELQSNMATTLPIWTTEWGDGGYAPWASALTNKTDDSVLERHDVRAVMYRLGVLGEGAAGQYQFANQTSDGIFGTEGLANQYGSLKIQAQAQRTLLSILPATGSGGSCSTSYTVGTGTAQNVFYALLYDAATCRHFTPIWLGIPSGPTAQAVATPLPTAYPRQFESTTVTLPAGDTHAYWCSYTDPTGIAMVCYPWPVTGGTTTIPISDELGMLVSDNNGAWTLPTPQPTQAPAPGPTPSAIPTSTPTPYPSPSP
jgi:hypothetical protein